MNPKTWTLAAGMVFLGVVGSAHSALAQRSQVETAMLLVQAKLAKTVIDYAQSKVDKRVGDGFSADLTGKALEWADAQEGTQILKQKGETHAKAQPGCIIRMDRCVFRKPDSSAEWVFPSAKAKSTTHCAIIKSVSGTSVVLLHQVENGNLKTSIVSELTLDLAWLKSGEYRLYLPTPRRPTGYIVCSPIDWTPVNLDAGRGATPFGAFFRDNDFIDLLKKHGFETQYRVVAGSKKDSSILTLFARLPKETKTPFFLNELRLDELSKELRLRIASLVYGGRAATDKQVRIQNIK